MTVKEAELIYDKQVEQAKEQHKVKTKKTIKTCVIVFPIIMAVGIILIIIGYSLTKVVYGNTFGVLLCKGYGWAVLGICSLIASFTFPILFSSLKKGPKNFLPQIKNLYYNYLKCEDLNSDYKEYYKQKLEDIRYAEFAQSINNASATTASAVMFSSLIK